MNEILNTGIIGVGNIGSAHAAAIYSGKVSGMRLTALCDTDAERRKKLSEVYPDIPVFASAEELISSGKIICSGGAKCEKNIKCDELSVSGSIKIGEDVEAEKIKIDGIINCSGLLNAEDIEIKFDKGMDIGSIGGSKIIIIKEPKRKFGERLPLLSSLVKKINGNVHVEGSIEGDEIALEAVTCPRVTGRVVAVGAGCDIDLVQYSDQIEVSPDARVGKTEKI